MAMQCCRIGRERTAAHDRAETVAQITFAGTKKVAGGACAIGHIGASATFEIDRATTPRKRLISF